MNLEIISRVGALLTLLFWFASVVCFTKNEVWQILCVALSFVVFGVGFVTCLGTVFYG